MDAVEKYRKRRKRRMDEKEWNSSKHPRGENGRFISSGGVDNSGDGNFDFESGPVGKFSKTFDDLQDVADLINDYYEKSGQWWSFGLRADKPGKKAGHVFKNSHQWYQDDPREWGEEAKFSKRKGMWDAGELDGVSTVGIKDGNGGLKKEDLEKAINLVGQYAYGDMPTLYLVGTPDGAEGGNDIGEQILKNGICFGEVKIKNERA